MKPGFNSKSHSATPGSLNHQKKEVTLASYAHMTDVLEEKGSSRSMFLYTMRDKVAYSCVHW